MKRKRRGRRKEGKEEEESGHEPPLNVQARFATSQKQLFCLNIGLGSVLKVIMPRSYSVQKRSIIFLPIIFVYFYVVHDLTRAQLIDHSDLCCPRLSFLIRYID